MNLENFRLLREINSLKLDNSKREKLILDEESRLKSLNSKKSKAQTELRVFQSDFIAAKDRLNQIDDQLKAHLNEQTKSKLENEGMILLEKIDLLQSEIKDKETFLVGIEKTFLEIKSEVDSFVTSEQLSITQNLHRIENLMSLLPSEVQVKLKILVDKKMHLGPFTTNQNGKCQMCLRSISKIDESEIDVKLSFMTCLSCGRIFLPYNITHS